MGRQIELKTVKAEGGESFEYKKVLMEHLKVSPQGVTIPEMEQALKIRKQIQDATTVVFIEDADYTFLVNRLDKVMWVVADMVIIDFMKYIKEVKSVDVNSVLATQSVSADKVESVKKEQ